MLKSRPSLLFLPLLLAALTCAVPGLPESDPPPDANPRADSGSPADEAPVPPADTEDESSGGSFAGDSPTMPLPYNENFSDPTGFWGNGAQGSGEYQYVDGTYEIRVLPAFQFYYVLPEDAAIRASDVIIEVDAWKTAGDDETSAGVMCRANERSDSFYAFEVTFDGWGGILKAVNGEFVIDDRYVQSDAVYIGTDIVNHMRVECIGSELKLYVNGTLVVELTDSELTEGEVGLSAATWPDKPDSAVRFDNLSVSIP